MKCTGRGTVTGTVVFSISLIGVGEDLDDCYGPASTDLQDIENELRLRLEHLAEGIKQHYEGAADNGMSEVDSYTVGVCYQFDEFNNGGEIDSVYDTWRDEQMLGGDC